MRQRRTEDAIEFRGSGREGRGAGNFRLENRRHRNYHHPPCHRGSAAVGARRGHPARPPGHWTAGGENRQFVSDRRQVPGHELAVSPQLAQLCPYQRTGGRMQERQATRHRGADLDQRVGVASRRSGPHENLFHASLFRLRPGGVRELAVDYSLSKRITATFGLEHVERYDRGDRLPGHRGRLWNIPGHARDLRMAVEQGSDSAVIPASSADSDAGCSRRPADHGDGAWSTRRFWPTATAC